MAVPHLGQCDAGQTMDWRRGTRCITTFRKLPTTRPSRPITTTIKLRLRAAQTCGSDPDAGVPSHLEPDGRTPDRCHEPGYSAGEGLLFERGFLSSAFSLAATFYCAAPTGRRVVPPRELHRHSPRGRRQGLLPWGYGPSHHHREATFKPY